LEADIRTVEKRLRSSNRVENVDGRGSAEVKDEWKLVAKVIDRLLLLVFVVIITALTVTILCVYPTLSDVDTAFT